MAKAVIYNQSGKKTGEKKLNPKIFDKKVNQRLLFEVAQVYLSNQRQATAKAKRKGEVSGGGRKPWRQKGTGRARTGSIRNPIFRGGGIIFGPTGEQNYKKVIPQKKRNAALSVALSAKAAKDQIILTEELTLKKPKTKELVEILSRLPVEGQILVVIPKKDFNLVKSASNIPNVYITSSNDLNALLVLNADRLIFIEDALEKIENRIDGVLGNITEAANVTKAAKVANVSKTKPKKDIKKIKPKKVKNEKKRK